MAVDATGKVRGSTLDDAVQISSALGNKAKTAKTAADGSQLDTTSVLDQVDLQLAKTIQDQLDPAKLSQERKDKVAKLKELIQSGQYKPSGEVIARSVNEELVQEIYFSQGTAQSQNAVQSQDSEADLPQS